MVYAPAIAMGVARAVALLRSGADARYFIGVLEVLDRLEYVYLVACFGGGLFVLVRALAEVRSITARRQLRWIAWGSGLGMTPFALGYALPWAIGIEPSLSMQLTAIPGRLDQVSIIPTRSSARVSWRAISFEREDTSIPSSYRVRSDDEQNRIQSDLGSLVYCVINSSSSPADACRQFDVGP